jgi:membrane complex biogenesis BtpA family protein
LDAVADHACRDAEALEAAGFDGVMVENFGDVPFYGDGVPAETVAAITFVTAAVRRATALHVGVNVLRNDAVAAIAVAASTGARFVRVNVHTGSMWTDQGLLHGRAHESTRLRARLAADVAILADVHVKHASPPAAERIEEAAKDAWHRGLADGLIVSGSATGSAVEYTDLEAVREAVPQAPVLVGSGVTIHSVADVLARAAGVIVGSAVMVGGQAGHAIDPERARSFAERARG